MDPLNTRTNPAYSGSVSRTDQLSRTDLNFKLLPINSNLNNKAFDEGFSSKNYVKKFLRALHPKWRAKVMAIEDSKDLSSLSLDKLIGNLKIHEVVMEKDSKIYKGKKERVKSIALKAKKGLGMMKLQHPEVMMKNMLWP
ncbi:hypothetical protein Tco_1233768 [Tanacetum coccineum]